MNTESTPTPIKPKKHKPSLHPRQERFERLFELAFQGLCAGARFHYVHPDGGEYSLDSKQQLEGCPAHCSSCMECGSLRVRSFQ